MVCLFTRYKVNLVVVELNTSRKARESKTSFDTLTTGYIATNGKPLIKGRQYLNYTTGTTNHKGCSAWLTGRSSYIDATVYNLSCTIVSESQY